MKRPDSESMLLLLVVNFNGLNTFLRPFLNQSDLKILKLSCKTFNQESFKNESHKNLNRRQKSK